MNALQQKIYNRLARYVAFDTTSVPAGTVTPTTDSQISFAHQMAAEMKKIADELKRCADELASTDLSMQALRDLILESE